MKTKVKSVEEYLLGIPEDRKPFFFKLREIILENLPEGFKEEINYGMIGYVVPHEIYPSGYHCTPELPLPFINIASQKNYISFYHMGIYADDQLLDWFVSEYKKSSKLKLDMGKSCIRFKKPEFIPFELIGKLIQKMSANDWIKLYEEKIKR